MKRNFLKAFLILPMIFGSIFASYRAKSKLPNKDEMTYSVHHSKKEDAPRPRVIPYKPLPSELNVSEALRAEVCSFLTREITIKEKHADIEYDRVCAEMRGRLAYYQRLKPSAAAPAKK